MPLGASDQDGAAVDYVAELIRVVPSLLWIALAFWAIWYLYPRIRKDILPNLKTFKGFGVEAEFVIEKVSDVIRAKGVEVPFGDRQALFRRVALAWQCWQGAHVLWVDDKPADLQAEKSLFESLGASITFVTTSLAGLEELNRRIFAVVISDMSREDERDEGAKFAASVWHMGRPAPVVIYTGQEQTGKPAPPFVFGITNRPDELLHLVMDILERTRA